MDTAGKIVEYQQNHKPKGNGRYHRPRGNTFREQKKTEKSNKVYKRRQLFRKKDYHDAMERESPANMTTCYSCSKLGHITKNCPEKAFLIKESPVDNVLQRRSNGKFVSNIQIDTGA